MAFSVMGGMMGGLAQGMMAARKAKEDEADRKERRDMMKLQMKQLDLKTKEEERKNVFFNKIVENYFPQTPGATAAELPEATIMPEVRPSAQDGLAGGQPPAAKPGAGLIDQLVQKDPMLALVMGHLSGLDFLGAQKATETARHNAAMEAGAKEGRQIDVARFLRGYDETTPVEVTGPGGEKSVIRLPKFGGAQTIPTGPAPTEHYTFEQGGMTFEGLRNKQTGAPIGPPKQIKEIKPESSDSASKIALANNAIDYVKKMQSAFINPDGSLNSELILKANAPLGGIGEGRKLKAMFTDALDARARAATGAAMPDSEIKTYTRMYFPSPLDNAATVKDKMVRLNAFMKDYLEVMDPGGRVRNRLNGGKVDMVFNPQTGRLEPAQ